MFGVGHDLAGRQRRQVLDAHIHADGQTRRRSGVRPGDLASEAHVPASGGLRHRGRQHPGRFAVQPADQLDGRLLGPHDTDAGQPDVAAVDDPEGAGGHLEAAPGVAFLAPGGNPSWVPDGRLAGTSTSRRGPGPGRPGRSCTPPWSSPPTTAPPPASPGSTPWAAPAATTAPPPWPTTPPPPRRSPPRPASAPRADRPRRGGLSPNPGPS